MVCMWNGCFWWEELQMRCKIKCLLVAKIKPQKGYNRERHVNDSFYCILLTHDHLCAIYDGLNLGIITGIFVKCINKHMPPVVLIFCGTSYIWTATHSFIYWHSTRVKVHQLNIVNIIDIWWHRKIILGQTWSRGAQGTGQIRIKSTPSSNIV